MPEMTDEEIAIEAVRNLGYGDYPKTTSAESAFGYEAAVEALRMADAIRKIGENDD